MEDEIDSTPISKPGLLKRMMFTGQLTRLTIYLIAAVPTIILIILGLLALAGAIQPFEISLGADSIKIGTFADYVLLALIIFTGVFGIYEFIRLKKVRKIDNRFPDFVRDLAESRRAGMTFTKAIMYSSKGNYGVLTPEIQKIARQISWGSSVDNALNSFAKRVNTKLIRRTISLIIEASRSGGNVADVLDAAARDAREIKLIESERRAGMLSYVAVIYVGLGVFILIVLILVKTLLPQMLNQGAQEWAQQASSVGISMGRGTPIQLADASSVFFAAAIFQSIGMGMVAGVFEEGNVVAGVKHIFIMLFMTWFVFKFILFL